MAILAAQEAHHFWGKLMVSSTEVLGTSLPTRGLGGRASGKRFTPTELKAGRLFLLIEGRETQPKQPPFITERDFELYLGFEKKEINRDTARKSFRTSYAGPLIDLLRSLD